MSRGKMAAALRRAEAWSPRCPLLLLRRFLIGVRGIGPVRSRVARPDHALVDGRCRRGRPRPVLGRRAVARHGEALVAPAKTNSSKPGKRLLVKHELCPAARG